ncbi:hypothetical protein CTI14_69635, partial [Methylobacterium radiotolerans]
ATPDLGGSGRQRPQRRAGTPAARGLAAASREGGGAADLQVRPPATPDLGGSGRQRPQRRAGTPAARGLAAASREG